MVVHADDHHVGLTVVVRKGVPVGRQGLVNALLAHQQHTLARRHLSQTGRSDFGRGQHFAGLRLDTHAD